MQDVFDLSGQTALVTGCRRGIGYDVAECLAEAGADVLGASAQLDSDSDIAQAVRRHGRKFTAFKVNLSNEDLLQGFIDQVLREVAQVDILVNNAGHVVRGPSESFSLQHWKDILQVNLTAQFVLAQAFGRQMLERGRGKIIFTGSVLSLQGGYNVAAYAASKHGVLGITKALANEWAGRGVNVNAVLPGYIATDLNESLRLDPEREASIRSRIPAGNWGTPRDVAGAYLFLASKASDYVHGATLPVDGGWLAR